MSDSETLLFISPRFLFPVDSGGKIRTTQTLRGLKGGRFKIRLLSPAKPQEIQRYRRELQTVCDDFVPWREVRYSRLRRVARFRHLMGKIPIPVASDYTLDAARVVERELAKHPSVAVFDFVHAAILAPQTIDPPSVLFTHNVEAEIFERHALMARNPLLKWLWRDQHRKMSAFEAEVVHRFDVVVAVSERDSQKFVQDYAARPAFVIPTGVDLEYFRFQEPIRDRDIVFCGSMDWLANQDGVGFFLEKIWPLIVAEVPDARMTVVGRAPPQGLIDAARRVGAAWTFTGFVDDVRPYMAGAAVSVVPLRIAGGTRLKVFESMAMGCAVVSTSVGVEGLPVEAGRHCIVADDPAAFAAATVGILRDARRRTEIARAARAHVEKNFGFGVAARAFERACLLAIERRGAAEKSVRRVSGGTG